MNILAGKEREPLTVGTPANRSKLSGIGDAGGDFARFDVHNVDSPKHVHTSYAVVEVTDSAMKVAEYDYIHRQWIWWHGKPLTDQGPKERIGVMPGLEPELRPDFDLGSVKAAPPWKPERAAPVETP